MPQYVKVDLSGLQRFQAVLEADLRGSGQGPIRKALRQWAAIYRAAMQERFDTMSRGGGDWPDLAESTKRRRRGAQQGKSSQRGKRGKKHAATGKFTILRDTSTLFAALDETFSGKPGSIQQDIPFGVRVGFGGPARHPKGKATIADIATFHQVGGPRLPKREIIVPPDADTVSLMTEVMDRGINEMTRG